MNQEPLTKEKIGKGSFENEYLLLGYCDKLLILDDVKSAVEWLLEEIEQKCREWQATDYYSQPPWGEVEKELKKLVRKAFEGVMRWSAE